MYWRVQKISVEQIAKAYGVYVVCLISVLVNLLLISRLPASNKLTVQQRTDFEGFAKEVTRHLTDAGFMTYSTSMSKLAFTATKPELTANVIKELTPDVLPPSIDAMKAIDKRLHESKSLSQLSIDEVKVDEPDASTNGCVPVEISGRVVRSSAGEVQGPDGFRFKLLVGMAKKGDESWPVVVAMRDLSAQAAPPQGQQ